MSELLDLETRIRLDEDWVKSPNLTGRFSAEDLNRIGAFVWEGYNRDLSSRLGWFKRTEAAMNLALQVTEAKSFPWANASNVAFPLVTIATLQFHSRAYPTIISGTDVVKCRLAGPQPTQDDCERAYRISRGMSYQVLEEDQSWEEQHDRLLINLPVVGCAFVKSYFSGVLGHNVSELVLAKDFVIDYYAKSVNAARRKSHVVYKYRNDIYEAIEQGLYRDIRDDDWYKGSQPPAAPAPVDGSDNRQGIAPGMADPQAPLKFVEQHCWLDLDKDGYEEPYIVLIDEASRAVVRLVARVDRNEDISRNVRGKVVSISATEFFTKYSFIPSPDGGIYDIGFGVLLGPLNESVNSLINQLIDAGTMNNTAGGFLGRGAKIRGGVYQFAPFTWARLDSTGDDIRKNLFPLPTKEPSEVLLKLLSLLIDFTNRVSGATEMLTGQNPGQNTPAQTSDHMVEQGLKIYAAIFKRVWRSMKDEFKKLYVLNAIHLPARLSTPGGVTLMREDYLGDPNQIVPSADPNVVSDSTRMQQALFLAQRAATVPGYVPKSVEMNVLRAARVDAPEQYYVGPEKTGPLPNPKMMVEQEKTSREKLKLKHQGEMFVFEMMEQHSLNEAKIAQLEASATALLAEAKGVDVQHQLNAINTAVGAMKAHNEQLHARAKALLDSTETENGTVGNHVRGLLGMGKSPGNTGGTQPLAPGNPGGQG